jgi:DNA-binding LacI/PurR family transcriptional regulator
VAFVGLEDRRIITVQAQRGFERALEKNRISLKDKVTIYLEPNAYQAETSIKEMLKTNQRITALFTESQILAEGAINAAKELGRRVPEDLAIMSMLENEMSANYVPALSGIDWKAKEIGDQAIQLLVKMMEGREQEVSGRVITTEIIIRDSCGTKKDKT